MRGGFSFVGAAGGGFGETFAGAGGATGVAEPPADALDTMLAVLETAGKLVCAWFLPLADPDQYLTLNGANVEGWAAAYGTQKVNLAELTSPPVWDASLFGGKAGVVFDGTKLLTGTGNVANWPDATADLYMLVAFRDDAVTGVKQTFSYGSSNSNMRALGSTGNRLGRATASTLVAQSAGSVAGAKTVGGAFDLGGNTTIYVDGALDVTAATASAPLTLTSVKLGCNPANGQLAIGAISCAAILNSTATLTDFTDLEALMRARLS